MLRKAFNAWGFDIFLFGLVVMVMGIAWHSFTADFEGFGLGVSQIGGAIMTVGLFVTAAQVLVSRMRNPRKRRKLAKKA
jgi:hypothetical protein